MLSRDSKGKKQKKKLKKTIFNRNDCIFCKVAKKIIYPQIQGKKYCVKEGGHK